MSAEIHRAFYVSCPNCHYEEWDFEKKDAERHATHHDCVRYLTRKWNYANQGVGDRFEVTITPLAGSPTAQKEGTGDE